MFAGRRYELDKSPYQAIEFVWNPANLWVNMQPNPKKYVSFIHFISLELVIVKSRPIREVLPFQYMRLCLLFLSGKELQHCLGT